MAGNAANEKSEKHRIVRIDVWYRLLERRLVARVTLPVLRTLNRPVCVFGLASLAKRTHG